jgi:hypothetical protein
VSEVAQGFGERCEWRVGDDTVGLGRQSPLSNVCLYDAEAVLGVEPCAQGSGAARMQLHRDDSSTALEQIPGDRATPSA